MKYAVIQTGGKQYLVNEGDTLLVDKLSKPEENLSDLQVLFIRRDSEYVIGQPFIDNVKIKGKIIDQVKGKKLRISKFKAKVNYRRTIGFRPIYSKIHIEELIFDSKDSKKKKISS